MEKEQVERLYREHYRQMVDVARTLVYDDEEARDVVSEVFASLLHVALPSDENVVGYLSVSVRNRCLDLLAHQLTTDTKDRNHDLHAFPTVHLSWQATDKLNLSAAWSRGISRPHFQYLNQFRYYMTPTRYFGGKTDVATDLFLNRRHSLVCTASYSHYFPYVSAAMRNRSFDLVYAQLRYTLPGDRLRLSLTVSDPFRLNITRTESRYADYTVFQENDVHARNVSFSLVWSLGGQQVHRTYRQSKNTEAQRAN